MSKQINQIDDTASNITISDYFLIDQKGSDNKYTSKKATISTISSSIGLNNYSLSSHTHSNYVTTGTNQTITGNKTFSNQISANNIIFTNSSGIRREQTSSVIYIHGGDGFGRGSSISLIGKDYNATDYVQGAAVIKCNNGNDDSKLVMEPQGKLTWQNKNIVTKVNGIEADSNGEIDIGFRENELYKFQQINSVDDLKSMEVKSGYCYYVLDSQIIEGVNVARVGDMFIAKGVYTFITPTTHTATLSPGTYSVVAIAGGGEAIDKSDNGAAGGGSGAAISCIMTISQSKVVSVTIGNHNEDTIISMDESNVLCAAHGSDANSNGWKSPIKGLGGLTSDCYVDTSIFQNYEMFQGNDGGTRTGWGGVDGGAYALPQYPYGGGHGVSGTMRPANSYDPQTGYVRIQKIA